jgi:hypothetical protein
VNAHIIKVQSESKGQENTSSQNLAEIHAP